MHYVRTIKEVCTEFSTSIQGLQADQIKKLQAEYGLNELPIKKKSLVLLFLNQFNNVLVYILIGALALSIAVPYLEGHSTSLKNYIDAIVIFTILLMNGILGFVQEFKAEEAINSLEKLTAPTVRVRRDGLEAMIPANQLVPGDIVLIEAGDRISADGRLVDVSHLQINESSLTGESQLITKNTEVIIGKKQISQQINMVFSGTLVGAGAGVYIVTETGIHTEIGKVAKMVAQTIIPQTPLQKRMKDLGRHLGILVLLLSIIIVAIGYFKQMAFIDVLVVAVSLAVSAVPEGLPAVITICFAIGVKRIVSKNAIVRRLDALETLGSVTVICSDKTGTITQNKMKVVDIWSHSPEELELLIQIGASCNRAKLPNLGDPTEIGLLEYAVEKNVEQSLFDEEEVAFNSDDKYMQTRHGEVSFIKGAPEVVVSLCSERDVQKIEEKQKQFALRGLRVLGCAIKEQGVTRFVGLIALEDPPRASIKQSIIHAKNAGIRCIMITGDSPITATAIAAQVGIKGGTKTGDELDELNEDEWNDVVIQASIFARVSPAHKLKILHTLQKQGEVVAMTGDGVNDAPALKGAHVGISMGLVGTQVAREASSIVLADDDFGTIVAAIEEGRRIYDNIKKFVLFLLRANFDELFLIMIVMILGLPLPYLALHILWVNLVTDGLPALALSMEKSDVDVMNRPPRNREQGLLHGEWTMLLLGSFIAFLIAFILFYILHTASPDTLAHTRSVVLTMAILFELLQAHSARSNLPIWKIGMFTNKWLNIATIIPLGLHFIILYTPIHTIFSLTALSFKDWGIALGCAVGGFIIFEILKIIKLKHII